MGDLMFAIFDNVEIFDAWHDTIKSNLGYPIFGTNQATGELDTDHAITEYTFPNKADGDDRVIAWVGELSQNLTLIDPLDVMWQAWFIQKDIQP
jgi:hypothetical protein